MTRKTALILAASTLSLAAGLAVGPRLLGTLSPPVTYVGNGSWAEPATTVASQAARADVIVRARVVARENRILTQDLPVYAADGLTVESTRRWSNPFTDVTFEVDETFKGKVPATLTVLQTGGTSRDERTGRLQQFEMAADPLFTIGSEHLLFLVDISNDGIHSKGRPLYRVVNPLGRYEIGLDGSLRGPRDVEHLDASLVAQLPRTEAELRVQLEQSLDR